MAPADEPALREIVLAVGLTTDPAASALPYISSMQEEHRLSRKLEVDGVLVGGGQLIRGRRPDCADLGFWVHPRHQRRGHGRRIAQGLIALGFTAMALHRIAARTSSRNLASRRTCESAGLQLDGVLGGEALGVEGDRYDELHLGLLRREWRPVEAAAQPG